jgi:hypothetical protein
METGCLFYKMRAGKHRLGPETRARVEEIDAAAQAAYAAFLQAARDAGEWPDGLSVEAGAKYLGEQIALAITQARLGRRPRPHPRNADAGAVGQKSAKAGRRPGARASRPRPPGS